MQARPSRSGKIDSCMNPEELETASLALVIELRSLLENALNSIWGKTTEGESTYPIHVRISSENYPTRIRFVSDARIARQQALPLGAGPACLRVCRGQFPAALRLSR